jgi:LytS/YehU family sensor histidine kinase
MLYKKRIATVRKQENEKNLLKQRIAEIEMTALRAQMNPHFIFNCLNSINRFILSHETDAASAYLTKFSRLIRMILDGSREDFITLDKELDALKLYIEMESMRFQAVFDWRIYIDPTIQIDNIMIPPLILQPYVENAIWHGLMQTPAEHPKKLMIQISKENSVIIIEIEDNGIGRKRAFEIKSKDGNTHKSHGITLTEERLKLMNKLKNVKTNITIEDLEDQDLKPRGTKIRLYFYI